MTDHKKRQSIPVTSRKVLRPEAKLSLRERAKNALKRAAGAIKRAAKKVVAVTKTLATRVWAKTSTAWRTALRPFLKAFGAVVAVVVWSSALVAAPLGTVALTASAGVLIIGLSRVLEALDHSSNRVAKLAIKVIEAIAQALRAAFYLWSAAIAVLTLPAWGPMAAIVGATYFILKALPRSEMMYEMPTQAPVDADLEVPAAKRRQKIEVVEPEILAERDLCKGCNNYTRVDAENGCCHACREAPVADKPKAIRAKGAEEMYDMPACDACGTIEGTLRARSHRRANDAEAHALLCSGCYDLECEDDALRFTGVSLKKMSTEVRLNGAGLEATSECAASRADDNVHWAPTAWWRDKIGTLHERAWSGFVRGEVVANVIFDYRRGTYRMLVMGKPPRDVGAQRSYGAARDIATDLWNDAVLCLEREMDEASEPAATPRVKAV